MTRLSDRLAQEAKDIEAMTADDKEVEYIDMTPTDDGYVNMHTFFVQAVSDWKNRLLNERMSKKDKEYAIDSMLKIQASATEIKQYLKSKGIEVN